MKLPPFTVNNSSSLIPITIYSERDDTNRRHPFARDLISDGWTMVPTPRSNMLVLKDWCAEHFDHSEFGYSNMVRAFIFKNVADAIQFKLACLGA